MAGRAESPRKSAKSTSPRNTWPKTRSKTSLWSWCDSRVVLPRADELPDRRRVGEQDRAGEAGAALRGDGHARLVEQVAEGRDHCREVGPGHLDPSAAARRSSTDCFAARTGSAIQRRLAARATSWSSRYFSTDPRVSSTPSSSRLVEAEQLRRVHPVDRLGDTGRLLHVEAAQPLHGAGDLRRPGPRSPPGTRGAHDRDRLRQRRVVDPVVEAAALERVVQVARAVRGEDHDRRVRGPEGAELGDRDGRLGEQLEQERLELLVGAVDLVDEEHGRARARVLERLQERPLRRGTRGAEQRLLLEVRAPRLREPDAEQLARVVPLVERLGRRRCPRSTAAGCRGVSSSSASDFAAWVLPDARPRPRAAAAAAGVRRRTAPAARPGRRGSPLGEPRGERRRCRGQLVEAHEIRRTSRGRPGTRGGSRGSRTRRARRPTSAYRASSRS